VDYEERFKNLMNGIADSILEMSDEEIREEAAEDGLDIRAEAEDLRKFMLNTIEKYKKADSILEMSHGIKPAHRCLWCGRKATIFVDDDFQKGFVCTNVECEAQRRRRFDEILEERKL